MARKAKAVILLRKNRKTSDLTSFGGSCAELTVREFRLRRIFLLVASPSELGSALLAKCELPQSALALCLVE